MAMKVLLALVLASVACLAYGQGFEGTYADRFGGFLYVCVDDGKIEGMYSEIGLVQGEVTNQVTANGDFYQAGVPGQACTTGSFSWSLEDGGRSFRGFYICADDGSQHEWSENKIFGLNFTTPSDQQCGRLADSGSVIEGNWARSEDPFEEASVCTDDDGDEWRSSYRYEETVPDPKEPGRENGHTYLDLRVLVGTFQEIQRYGVVLRFLAKDGGILTSRFAIKADEQATPDVISAVTDHRYYGSQFVSDADDEDCDVNKLVDYGETYAFEYPLDSDNLSSSDASGLVALCMVMVVCLLCAALFS